MSAETTVVYEFAGHRLDPLRRLLTRGGQAVALFPRCFDALLLLVEHRGELLDKEFLLRALWPDVVVDENSLAKVVSEIRRALGEGPRDPGCIATVPRRGYRFTVPVQEWRDAMPGAATRPAPEVRALAVLPFTFVNPVGGDEYLGLGLADALITRLGQLRRTVLRPTSSVARFGAQPLAPAAAGRALEVDLVITGNVRRAGSMLRVGVQMVSVKEDAVVWSEKFDSGSMEPLALEDSIAERVATALTLALSRAEKPPEPRRYTASADAYEHFIRGRYLMSKRTRDALLDAVGCFERAIDIDPRYALAHAGVGAAWVQLGIRAAVSQSFRPREVMPKARAAAERALILDDSLSEAHSILGHVLVVYEWQPAEGIAALERAIELNPSNQDARHWYAMSLGGLGRFDEALVQIARAREIDPLAVIVNANIGFLLYRANRLEEAVTQLRHTVAMEPGFTMTRYRLGLALEALGQYDEAIEHFEAMRPCAQDPLGLTGIARTRALMGQTTEARRLLGDLEQIARQMYVPAFTLAGVCMALGEHERALDFLELGLEERALVVIWLPWDRHWDAVRVHPRFQLLLKRAGLKEKA